MQVVTISVTQIPHGVEDVRVMPKVDAWRLQTLISGRWTRESGLITQPLVGYRRHMHTAAGRRSITPVPPRAWMHTCTDHPLRASSDGPHWNA